jgi:hypothetical protein
VTRRAVVCALVGMMSVLWSLSAAFAADGPRFKPLRAERNNYCIDDAVTWVKQRLGPDTAVRPWMDRSGIPEKGVTGFRVIVWTDKCDGYFTMGFGTRGTPECTTPQYGERDPMLQMVGASGECRRFVPTMEMIEGRQ